MEVEQYRLERVAKVLDSQSDIATGAPAQSTVAAPQLLNAYIELAKTALDKTATLAMDINTGGSASAIDTLVKLSRNASMPSGDSRESLIIPELHNRADQRLREAGWAAIAKEASRTNLDQQKTTRKELVNSLLLILQDHSDLVDLAANPTSR